MRSTSQKVITTLLTAALLMGTGLCADAISIFSIGGEVIGENGQPVADGTEVILENTTQDVKLTVKVGERSKSGAYTATFSTIEQGQSVVEVGDEISITVNDVTGKKMNIHPRSYRITASDIANARAIVDLQEVVAVGDVELRSSTDTLPGDGTAQALVYVTVKDEQGNGLSNQTVEFEITPREGQISQTVIDHGDGTYTAIYTASEFFGTIEISARVRGIDSNRMILVLADITPSAGLSTITARTSVVADGVDASTVKVTLRTEDGQPVAGKQVVITDEAGNPLTSPTDATDRDGETTATLTSTQAGTRRISALVIPDGIQLTDATTVDFRPGPAATVDVQVSEDTLFADGLSTSEITIIVTDGHGNRITDEPIYIAVSNGAVGPLIPQDDGTYRATYTAPTKTEKPTEPETVPLTASATNGVRGQAEITLTPVIVEIMSVSVAGGRADNDRLFAKAGDRIEVIITTQPPNGAANFSIEGVTLAQNVSMPETTAPGTYTGGYTIREDDDVTDAVITITFQAVVGNPVANTDTHVTIDTIPPPAPTNLELEGGAITARNQNATVFTGNATPNATVMVTLTDESGKQIEQSRIADGAGAFALVFDASSLKDEVITIRAVEETDLAGNDGIPAEIQVLKIVVPGFSIGLTKGPDDPGEPGSSLVYFLSVLGINDFIEEVRLEAVGLPSGVTAIFSPETVTPTLLDPSQDTQLTLIIGNAARDVENHPFGVLGTSGDRFRRLDLTLTIMKLPCAALLSLRIVPTESVPLGESIAVLGEIQRIDDECNPPTGLPITLTYQTPTGEEIQQDTPTDPENKYEAPFTPTQIGTWHVTTSWAGNDDFNRAERGPVRFDVKKGISQIQWQQPPQVVKLGESEALTGTLDPPLEGEEINLRIVDASGIATVETVTTLQNGLFEYLFTPDEKEEWAIIATWLGNTEYESVAAEIRIQIVVERAAIVLLGGGDEVDNPSWRRFNGVAQYVYRILKKRTYSDDDIYFLSPSREKTETIDDVTSKERLQFAILNWAKPRINANTPLFLYMISHNTADRFLIEKQGDQQIFLSVEELAEMLNVLPDVVPVRVVIEACHSANFIIKEGDDGRPLLPRHNRIVIASAKSDQQAKVSDSLSSFSKFFFDYLEDDPPDPNIDSRPLGDAFAETQALMTLHPLHRGQLPQFDAGNGVPNEPDDFVAAKDVFIPENILSLGNPPDILGLTGVTTGATSARITAEVTGAAVERVFVTITPPDYDPTVPFGDDEWGKYDVPIVDLHPVEGEVGHYAAEYDQLTTPGIYTIVAFASNTDGDSALPVQGTIPVSPPAPWDINNDSVVNIFDLVLVGGEFGKTPPDNPATDVTGDGSVNIFDLVTVATHFGETVATAPPAIDVRQTASIHESKHKQIHLALVELEGLRNPSEGAIIARKLLRAWLANATPTVAETKVLQNYPNPFNPETWIPYQLAEPAVVTISIYSATGRRIRTLHLGQQATGFYIEPSKAAYWDGRNRFGESVASGIYFYQIRAGDFSATRRMAIVK